MQFTSNYESKVIIYERKFFIRLATGVLFNFTTVAAFSQKSQQCQMQRHQSRKLIDALMVFRRIKIEARKPLNIICQFVFSSMSLATT